MQATSSQVTLFSHLLHWEHRVSHNALGVHAIWWESFPYFQVGHKLTEKISVTVCPQVKIPCVKSKKKNGGGRIKCGQLNMFVLILSWKVYQKCWQMCWGFNFAGCFSKHRNSFWSASLWACLSEKSNEWIWTRAFHMILRQLRCLQPVQNPKAHSQHPNKVEKIAEPDLSPCNAVCPSPWSSKWNPGSCRPAPLPWSTGLRAVPAPFDKSHPLFLQALPTSILLTGRPLRLNLRRHCRSRTGSHKHGLLCAKTHEKRRGYTPGSLRCALRIRGILLKSDLTGLE